MLLWVATLLLVLELPGLAAPPPPSGMDAGETADNDPWPVVDLSGNDLSQPSPPPTATSAPAIPEALPVIEEAALDDSLDEAAAPPPPSVQAQPIAPPPPAASTPPAPPATTRASRAADVRTPAYQRVRPKWGFELSGSARALGNDALLLGQEYKNMWGVSAQFEYQPEFLQSIGVVSFGPSVQVYRQDPHSGFNRNILSMWSFGAQVRYQARYFHEQPVVPFIGARMEYFSYYFTDQFSGHLPVRGGFLGAMFLLNVVEPREAAAFYANYGVARSYLLAEVRSYDGLNEAIDFAGYSYFFGLRIEF